MQENAMYFDEVQDATIDQNLDQGSKFSSKIKVLGIASKRMGA
jgi:hypothetical protein